MENKYIDRVCRAGTLRVTRLARSLSDLVNAYFQLNIAMLKVKHRSLLWDFETGNSCQAACEQATAGEIR